MPSVSIAPMASENTSATFPIVGIGASAGGLEALGQFFRHAPANSGMAFVLVQHLDPSHASLLAEILQRTTTMPVVEAVDQIAVKPNCVYVIPPNRDMAIFHGKLQLSVPNVPRGQRMPIDAFLRSLADDRQESAIGIILSGSGADGTQGLRAILGAGGVTLVQDPSTAKYDGMPSSAIKAGYATCILPADKMPTALLACVRSAAHAEILPSPGAASGVTRILMQLRSITGHDFSPYKKSTLVRSIERRMSRHNIGDTGVYARHLKENPAEVHALLKDLLINVTRFFRDAEAFAILQKDILSQLCKDKTDDYPFRVWVAGCSTGEEAYSIAILLRELMDEAHQEFKVQIYGTDLDDDAIAVARTGIYPPNIAQDVAPERLRHFFIKEDAGYRVNKVIREMVVFAVQNVTKDPPFTKLDLLGCRNLMIYLEADMQNRLIPMFHYALKPGGVLFLSPSESIGKHAELFSSLNRKWKLYRANHSVTASHPVMTHVLSQAAETGEKTVIKPKEGSFAGPTRRKRVAKRAELGRIEELEHDLAYLKESQQVAIEEQQTSNEEMQSTNEELQSANEELITVNSELQAKIEQLASMQNDMKNLLDNTNIGTVFLDGQLIIRRFTREATTLYRLVASDVGRPLSDINSYLEGEDILVKARSVLATLVPIEQEVQTHGGAWYLLRIQPYCTLDNLIEGIVLTFTDIGRRIEAETAVRLARELAESIVDAIREPLLVLDGDLQVVSANRAFYQFFQVTVADTVGRKIYDLGNSQWNIPALRELLEIMLPRDRAVEGYVVEHDFPVIGHHKIMVNARRMVGKTNEPSLILLTTEDIGNQSTREIKA